MAVRILTYFWRWFPTSTASLPTVEAVCRAMAFAENNNITQKQMIAGVYVGMISHPCGKSAFLNGISRVPARKVISFQIPVVTLTERRLH